MARAVDIMKVHNSLYNGNHQQFHTKSVTVTVDKELNQYISIFNYGSVIFFNIPNALHFEHLRRIKDAAVMGSIAEGLQHTEDYRIMVSYCNCILTHIFIIHCKTVFSSILSLTLEFFYFIAPADWTLRFTTSLTSLLSSRRNTSEFDI